MELWFSHILRRKRPEVPYSFEPRKILCASRDFLPPIIKMCHPTERSAEEATENSALRNTWGHLSTGNSYIDKCGVFARLVTPISSIIEI